MFQNVNTRSFLRIEGDSLCMRLVDWLMGGGFYTVLYLISSNRIDIFE